MSKDGAVARTTATAAGAGSGSATAAAAAAGVNRRIEPQNLGISPIGTPTPVTELRPLNAISASRIEKGNRSGNGVLMPPPPPPSQVCPTYPVHRLRLNPDNDHRPDSYEDLQLDFSPLLFSSLERYLPPTLLNSSRDNKVTYMRDILLRYSTESDRTRVQKHREYRQKIISNYQPLHKDLYTMHPENFFVPSFLNAVRENRVESFRSIMTEPSPGVFTFEMLQPRFCEMLLAEVENFEKWVHETKFRIMRPNTMNRYGAVLDDFGLETMLDKLMEEFIRPMSRVFFSEVGGSSLDMHHGSVLEYGMERDVDLGFHVDDSEVTLNVCLGKQFSGGELFFRGVRCEKHVNTGTQSEAILKEKMQKLPEGLRDDIQANDEIYEEVIGKDAPGCLRSSGLVSKSKKLIFISREEFDQAVKDKANDQVASIQKDFEEQLLKFKDDMCSKMEMVQARFLPFEDQTTHVPGFSNSKRVQASNNGSSSQGFMNLENSNETLEMRKEIDNTDTNNTNIHSNGTSSKEQGKSLRRSKRKTK